MVRMSLVAALSLLATQGSWAQDQRRIQISPKSTATTVIPDICGTWKLGVPPAHPTCRSVDTGGAGLHMEHNIYSTLSLGPRIAGVSETVMFASEGKTQPPPPKGGTYFESTATYWSDSPCFAGKPGCMRWNMTGGKISKITGEPEGECISNWGPQPRGIKCPKYRATTCKGQTYDKVCDYPMNADDRAKCGSGCFTEQFFPGCGVPANPWKPSALESWQTKEETIKMSGYVRKLDCMCVTRPDPNNASSTSTFDLPNRASWFPPTGPCRVGGVDTSSGCAGDGGVYSYENFFSNAIFPKYSTPAMFVVIRIQITPESDAQLQHVKANCDCIKASVKKGVPSDVMQCTITNCPYLATKGLFSLEKDAICKSKYYNPEFSAPNIGFKGQGRCLYGQMYRHLQNFLYVSKLQPTFAMAAAAPIYADGVYNLDKTTSCAVSASSQAAAPTLSVMLVTAFLIATLRGLHY